MRFRCPICGERDLREFTYAGVALERPAEDAGNAAWEAYVHLRDNPAGDTRDLWQQSSGCGAWIVVTRDTRSHEVTSTELVGEAS